MSNESFTDLWKDTAPAFGMNNSWACSTSREEGCVYEDALFNSFVVNAIQAHDPSRPLFLYYAPHAVRRARAARLAPLPSAQRPSPLRPGARAARGPRRPPRKLLVHQQHEPRALRRARKLARLARRQCRRRARRARHVGEHAPRFFVRQRRAGLHRPGHGLGARRVGEQLAAAGRQGACWSQRSGRRDAPLSARPSARCRTGRAASAPMRSCRGASSRPSAAGPWRRDSPRSRTGASAGGVENSVLFQF